MKDYYSLLGIAFPSSLDEINNAYRQMAKRWHPDLNPGKDVSEMMKDINEAAEILRDPVKKKRYDVEYIVAFGENREQKKEDTRYENSTYEPKDENLRNDINTAKKNADEYVKEFMSSFRSSTKKAAKGAWEEMRAWVIVAIISGLLATICTRM